jgi:hypothetical protein
MSAWQRFFATHRQRLARIVAVAFVLGFVLLMSPAVPRSVDIDVLLGPRHSDCTEVRLAYTRVGDTDEEMGGVLLTFPEGAPERVRHTVKLPEGEFEVRAEAHGPDGVRAERVSTLHAPTDDVFVIRLPSTPSSQGPR